MTIINTDTGAPVVPPAPPESLVERYASQTRNATCFIAWVVGLSILASAIIGIVIAVGVHDANVRANNFGNITNCQSLGGTDPTC